MSARLAAKSVHCEKWNMTLQRSESHAKKQSGQCFKRRIIAEFIMAKYYHEKTWKKNPFLFCSPNRIYLYNMDGSGMQTHTPHFDWCLSQPQQNPMTPHFARRQLISRCCPQHPRSKSGQLEPRRSSTIRVVMNYLDLIVHTSPRERSTSKVVYCQFFFRNP